VLLYKAECLYLSVFVSLFVCLLLVNSVPLQPTPKYITYSESADPGNA